jgi:hypothetical protein
VSRLDACLAFFFFRFLIIAALTATTPTQNLAFTVVLGSRRTLHRMRVVIIASAYDKKTERVHRLVSTSMSLYSNLPCDMDSEATLATMCSPLVAYDAHLRIVSFAVWSPSHNATIACMHSDPAVVSAATFSGLMSSVTGLNGTYLVSPRIYQFWRSLVKAFNFSTTLQGLALWVNQVYETNPLLKLAQSFHNRSIDYIDPRALWSPGPVAQHLMCSTYPPALVLRDLNSDTGADTTNYLRVPANGTGLATSTSFSIKKGSDLCCL